VNKILLATTNQKKLKELQELLEGLELECVCLKDFSDIKEVEETGKTFDANAILKAEGYAKQTGLLTLGEDSGLCCEALEGAPGIYSARFSGEDKSDEKNNQKLLKVLDGLPDNCRGAYYQSSIAIATPDNLIGVVNGKVHGAIAKEPQGTGGFGYDPIFFYPPFQKTFGQVPSEEKHKVSHRFNALQKAKAMLQEHLCLRETGNG